MADAFPLQWPEGWPRTPVNGRDDARYRFQRRDGIWTFAPARDAMMIELDRHAKGRWVLSSNFAPSRGVAVEGKRRPDDQGVAIYFSRAGKSMAIACDQYTRAEENFRSLTLALEALRQLERHGGGVMVEKAFSGFVALPAPLRPHEVLEIAATATEAEIKTAWRAKIAAAHPDQGGSEAAAAEINAARDSMLKGLKP